MEPGGSEAPVISGAREVRPNCLRRLVARAMARDLHAFVVPGPEVARARGLDLGAAGLTIVDTPRHASVLVLAGELPASLIKAAAVAYAQMPRPRAVLALGTGEVSPLPEPDVSVGSEQGDVRRGVAEVRRLIADGAFGPEVTDFDVDAIRTRTEYTCSMHPEVVQSEPGSCPACGMDLVPRESAGGGDHGHTGHCGEPGDGHPEASGEEDHDPQGDPDHGEPGYSETEEDAGEGDGGMDHGEPSGTGAGHEMHGGEEDETGMDHSSMNHGDGRHDRGGMDHGGMDFMSMVEMTKDLPRSPDGLPMEWVEVPFGPLLPGLPAGLSLTLTLDGDTAAEAKTELGMEGWASPESLSGPVEAFADRLARLDPLSPVAYHVLALRATEDAAGPAADPRTALARVGALERERAASHLGWLSSFAHLIGYGWLEGRAAKLQLALLRATDPVEVSRLEPEVGKLSRRVERTPLLRRKLMEVGGLPYGAQASGPVARARGVASDVRTEDETYRSLGFDEPIILDGDDALSRLRVRLAEAERSLELVRRAGRISVPEVARGDGASGKGTAVIETPRGTARLRVALDGGSVTGVEIDTPSARHLGLVEGVAKERELADALVGVASLDLSPWEVVR